ncbi:MAG: winged helix-turn-helix transcriptional regulator [Candidatus Aenigmatarchaeota archaeon]
MVRKSNKNIDYKIIKILENNSRIKYTRLGKILGISEAAVRKKISKLMKEGIIKKFTVEVDWKHLNMNLAIIGFDACPEKIDEIILSVKNFPNIKKFYFTSGDHDFLIFITYHNKNDLTKFIKKLKKTEGIKKVCPAVLIEEI